MDLLFKKKVPLSYEYIFSFKNGAIKKYILTFDQSLNFIPIAINPILPEWTKLDYNQCSNCPFTSADCVHCPVAKNLAYFFEEFKDHVSHEIVVLQVINDRRSYQKETSLQKSLGSMIGMVMATSGCPILDRLKALVNFHLPLATTEEMTFKILSSFLMKRFFMNKKSESDDFNLEDLIKFYEEIKTVDSYFAKRLYGLESKDATLNAIVILNALASTLLFIIENDKMGKLESYFEELF